MREAVIQLNALVQEWVQAGHTHVPEVEWSRMRQLEFQETLRNRNALAQTLYGNPCLQCPDFESHVRRLLVFICLDRRLF